MISCQTSRKSKEKTFSFFMGFLRISEKIVCLVLLLEINLFSFLSAPLLISSSSSTIVQYKSIKEAILYFVQCHHQPLPSLSFSFPDSVSQSQGFFLEWTQQQLEFQRKLVSPAQLIQQINLSRNNIYVNDKFTSSIMCSLLICVLMCLNLRKYKP